MPGRSPNASIVLFQLLRYHQGKSLQSPVLITAVLVDYDPKQSKICPLRDATKQTYAYQVLSRLARILSLNDLAVKMQQTSKSKVTTGYTELHLLSKLRISL